MDGNILSRRAPPGRSPPPTLKRKLDEGPSTEHGSEEGQVLDVSKAKKQATSVGSEAKDGCGLKQRSDGSSNSKEPAVINWKTLNENERKQVEAWKRGRFKQSTIRGLIHSLTEEIQTTLQSSKLPPIDSKQQCMSNVHFVVTEASISIVKTLAKMFIGDLVEEARCSMVNAGVPQASTITQKPLPIPPEYYLEAWRQLLENNEVPGVSQELFGEHSVLSATPSHECQPRGLI